MSIHTKEIIKKNKILLTCILSSKNYQKNITPKFIFEIFGKNENILKVIIL